MALKIAFMGLRHGHIFAVYNHAKEMDGVEVVAACEEDAATREEIAKAGAITVTHTSFDEMLAGVDFDILAVGDYYGRRGSIIIQALRHGKHVISDKPICTSLPELRLIRNLASEKGLSVGCQLDLRDGGNFIKVREIVRSGGIGRVQAITVFGQHPLNYGSRPAWYFEEGKHGGTINDIGIHAFDIIPWITGHDFARINAARSWNAFIPQVPYFDDGGQFMLTMENGCGILGDVSYFAPGGMGYSMDQYWRLTVHGEKGMLETSCSAKGVTLASLESQAIELLEPSPAVTGGYFTSFLNQIKGECEKCTLTTEDVLRSAEVALKVQQAAYEGAANVSI